MDDSKDFYDKYKSFVYNLALNYSYKKRWRRNYPNHIHEKDMSEISLIELMLIGEIKKNLFEYISWIFIFLGY